MTDATTPPQQDPLAAASASIAWVIVLNKPFFPLYVWGYVGSGTLASVWTNLSLPFYLAVALGAKRWPLAARIGLPIVGVADTLFSSKIFGQAAGAELYFAPCGMIATLSFASSEKWGSRGLLAFVWLAFFTFNGRYGAPLHVWSAEELARLLTLNSFSVASLMVFVGWRFSGVFTGRG